ncbi:fimbrial protein [Serratia ureilytica]|uniref:fimbrial protein n=1 Tax=Serratia ureilytica TaxID=300181 RepID=UPI001C104219|nr:fimbrial protein [Serratia ureilytica]MBU5412435.1 fimbrial protein [Serratia ureilytica]
MLLHKRGGSIAIFLAISITSPLSSQAELGKVNLRITATLVANSCTVSTSSKHKIVDMGSWSTKQFSATSQKTPPTLFSIKLENCSATTTGVTTTFNGVADSVDATLLAVSGANSAQNIAIAILDKEQSRIPLGQGSKVYGLSPNASFAVLNFYSQYVATAPFVSPGTANAEATFTLDYQ